MGKMSSRNGSNGGLECDEEDKGVRSTCFEFWRPGDSERSLAAL